MTTTEAATAAAITENMNSGIWNHTSVGCSGYGISTTSSTTNGTNSIPQQVPKPITVSILQKVHYDPNHNSSSSSSSKKQQQHQQQQHEVVKEESYLIVPSLGMNPTSTTEAAATTTTTVRCHRLFVFHVTSGKRIGTLELPEVFVVTEHQDNKDPNNNDIPQQQQQIHSLCSITIPKQQQQQNGTIDTTMTYIVVGCNDSIIHVFDIQQIIHDASSSSNVNDIIMTLYPIQSYQLFHRHNNNTKSSSNSTLKKKQKQQQQHQEYTIQHLSTTSITSSSSSTTTTTNSDLIALLVPTTKSLQQEQQPSKKTQLDTESTSTPITKRSMMLIRFSFLDIMKGESIQQQQQQQQQKALLSLPYTILDSTVPYSTNKRRTKNHHSNSVAVLPFDMRVIPIKRSVHSINTMDTYTTTTTTTNWSNNNDSGNNDNDNDDLFIVLSSATKLLIYYFSPNNVKKTSNTELVVQQSNVNDNDNEVMEDVDNMNDNIDRNKMKKLNKKEKKKLKLHKRKNNELDSIIQTFDSMMDASKMLYPKSNNSNSNSNNNNKSHYNNNTKKLEALTAIDIDLCNYTMACGYSSGTIRIYHNIFILLQEYLVKNITHTLSTIPNATSNNNTTTATTSKISMKRFMNQYNLIIQNVHWHAHAVTTLCYEQQQQQQLSSQFNSTNVATISSNSVILYSGGEESVLVSWELSSNRTSSINKPYHTLPRISYDRINYLLYQPPRTSSSSSSSWDNNNGHVIVLCNDNTIQLYDITSPNKELIWKHQGLAIGGSFDSYGTGNRNNSIVQQSQRSNSFHHHDYPRSSSFFMSNLIFDQQHLSSSKNTIVILSGLDHAPGCIHWYDTKSQCVIQQLEVVSYNRVSNTERNTKANIKSISSPKITHTCFSNDYRDLCTIDVVPTENKSIGSISTIRFWYHPSPSAMFHTSIKSNDDNTLQPQYECIAAMTYPHGSQYHVHAMTMSSNGKYVITYSNDELAFRIWTRTIHHSSDEHVSPKRNVESQQLLSEWICQCKVSTPCGYANYPVSAIAFSNDTSVIAIAYGPYVTLWDHRNDNIRLLSTIRQYSDNVNNIQSSTIASSTLDFVEQIQFFPMDNMILLKSVSCVSLQSPFSILGPPNIGWSWVVPTSSSLPSRISKSTNLKYIDDVTTTFISHTEYLPKSNIVAIVQYMGTTNDNSRIMFVDATTGEVCNANQFQTSNTHSETSTASILKNIRGKVVSITFVEHEVRRLHQTINGTIVRLVLSVYVVTSFGEMICISNQKREQPQRPTTMQIQDELFNVNDVVRPKPLVQLVSDLSKHANVKNSKRRRILLDIDDLVVDQSSSKQKRGIDSMNVITNGTFPSLRGAFVRAYMGRQYNK